VLLVEDGRLVDMRTLRLGDVSVAEALARAQSLALGDAMAAIDACRELGTDYELEVAAAVPQPATESEGEELPAAPTTRRVTVTHAAVVAEEAGFLQRLSRELIRFLTSSGASPIDALWITGSASRMEGMAAMLADVGVEPRELDVWAGCSIRRRRR
jgi:Tfp pilus assembly PilM family ATPase